MDINEVKEDRTTSLLSESSASGNKESKKKGLFNKDPINLYNQAFSSYNMF